jgi:hypothetical protein
MSLTDIFEFCGGFAVMLVYVVSFEVSMVSSVQVLNNILLESKVMLIE